MRELSFIASIANELRFEPDLFIFKENEVSDSMFIVVEGEVLLEKNGKELMIAKEKKAFGTRALLNDDLRLFSAKTLTDYLKGKNDEKIFFMRVDFNNFYNFGSSELVRV